MMGKDMSGTVSLTVINAAGVPRGYSGVLPSFTKEVFSEFIKLYGTVGFEEPWVGYLAFADEGPVGCCGFKSSPFLR